MQGAMDPADVEKLRFDGVYRPEPWLADDRWIAVRYTAIRLPSGRVQADRKMDSHVSRDRQRAQARCDELNATRMDVSRPAEPALRPNRLL